MNVRALVAGPVLALMLAAGQSYGRVAQEPVPDDLRRPAKEAFLNGDYREAERYFREAWQEAEARGATATERASILGGLANTLLTQGRFTESESLFSRALEITEREAVEVRIRPALLLNSAWLYTQTYRYDRAESQLKEALFLGTRQFGPEGVFVAGVLKNLGILYAYTERIKPAEDTLKKALAIAEKQGSSRPQDFASILTSLSAVYAVRKQWNKAESVLTRSIDVIEHSVGPDHFSMSDALGNLGELYALQKKFGQAETLLRQALGIRQRAFGADNITVALISYRLAIVLTAQKKYAEANTLFLSSLPIQERVLGPKSPDLLVALEEFATLLRKMENSSQAEIVEARAKNIRFELTYTVPANRLKR